MAIDLTSCPTPCIKKYLREISGMFLQCTFQQINVFMRKILDYKYPLYT